MKGFLTLFFVLLFAFGKAQDSTKTNYRFSFGTSLHESSADEGIAVCLMYNHKKHTVFVGMLLPRITLWGSSRIKPMFYCGYRIYPNPKQKHFDLFFEYNFEADITNYSEHYGCGYPYSYEDIKYKYRFFSNTFCFGFRFSFAKRFYLETDLGIGFGFENAYNEYTLCSGN